MSPAPEKVVDFLLTAAATDFHTHRPPSRPGSIPCGPAREVEIRILGALVIGLIWAAAWAAVGALIVAVEPNGFTDDLWLGPPIGMYPGFLSGVIFFAILGIAGRRRRLAESSLGVVVACGGMAGLLVGVLPFVINTPRPGARSWLVASVVIGSMTFLSALSAGGSLALARSARAVARRRS